MLVLTRKAGEKVVVGNIVLLTVLDTRQGRVRLGIDAPRHIPVHRQEIWERVVAGEADGNVSHVDQSRFFAEFA